MPRYLLKIEQDHDPSRPDEGSIGRMVSFSNRHGNFEDPEQWMTSDCPKCEGSGWIAPKGGSNADAGYGQDDEECKNCEATGRVDVVHPDVLTMLNYYEHGLCKWYIAPAASPVDMQWDGAYNAGVIVWNGEDSERAWWDGMTDAERHSILEGIAETFTDWSNGEVYGYILERLDECDMGYDHTGDHIDSCWGYIGIQWLGDAVHDLLVSSDIAREDVTIGGEFGYVFEYPSDKKASV